MDFQASRSGSPTPLQTMSPERVNQQQGNLMGFDSSIASVSDKISQFNTLAIQSKQLERKTADAALKRAMLGREEAETEARRYREEARQMRKQVDEGRDRERRVGERLETVMENYGRAKETHAHTQALWEKEIRRARKETFKSQSAIVKLQEELKAARASTRAAEEALVHEKERSKAREQEAFQARYELVGCQEELEQTLQKVKILEQERDAFKSLAKSEEEVARIASEGRLPLPPPDSEEEAEEERQSEKDDAEKPEKGHSSSDNDSAGEEEGGGLLAIPKQRPSKRRSIKGRVSSFTLLDIKSSATSEAEIEEITRLWQWEKQRADRSSELVEYLEAECHLRACSCMKKRPRASLLESARKRQALDIGDSGDRIILSEKAAFASPTAKLRANMLPEAKKTQQSNLSIVQQEQDHEHSPEQKHTRLSTIFIPEEGVFRTVSQQISEEMEEAVAAAALATVAAMPAEPCDDFVQAESGLPAQEQDDHSQRQRQGHQEQEYHEQQQEIQVHHEQQEAPLETAVDENIQDIQDADTTVGDVTTDTAYTVETTEQSIYARTPSVDPPAFAQQRTSLLSLLNAPHRQEAEQPINFYVPTMPGPAPAMATRQVTVVRDSNACMEINMEDTADEHAPRAAASILMSSASRQDMDDTEMGDTMDDGDEMEEEMEESRISDVTEVYSRGSQRQEGQPPVQKVEHNKENRDEFPQAPRRYETPAMMDAVEDMHEARFTRPHTVTGGVFAAKTTTTKVPLREETTDPSLAQRIMAGQRTPQSKILSSSVHSDNSNSGDIGGGPSFDINNPALTPTMSREECLAQIRERRGRARSAASGSTSSSASSSNAAAPSAATGSSCTPRRPVTPGKERREISAPVRRMASARRVRS